MGTKLKERPSSKSIKALINGEKKYIIDEQGIHAFTTYSEAERRLRVLKLGILKPYCDAKIIQGTIPKGTFYWESILDDNEIAAKYIDFGLKEYKENWLKRLIHKII